MKQVPKHESGGNRSLSVLSLGVGVWGEEVVSLDSIHVKALYKKSLIEPAAL